MSILWFQQLIVVGVDSLGQYIQAKKYMSNSTRVVGNPRTLSANCQHMDVEVGERKSEATESYLRGCGTGREFQPVHIGSYN